MRNHSFFSGIGIVFALLMLQSLDVLISGCAQIGAPTGGPKDTAAPVLLKSVPAARTLNVSGNKITFSFDEFVELQDLQNNLTVSPFQKTTPIVNSNLKTITLKIKDSLLPNTTYQINFGNAIKDINEGNVLKNFSYVFSTGNHIDSLHCKGKVIMAQTGKVDSTLSVLLYRNAPDSAISSRRPDYLTKLDGKGQFFFNYLPPGSYSIYALKDGDGNKYYNAKTETFAFSDNLIDPSVSNASTTLWAYAEKEQKTASAQPSLPGPKKDKEKKLRYSDNLISGQQDLLSPLELSFKNGLKKILTDSIVLTDTAYKPIAGYRIETDSLRKKLTIVNKWIPGMIMKLVIFKNSLEDSTGLVPAKNDTVTFMVKNTNEYGSLKIKFNNINLTRHPLLQFMDGETVKWKYPLVSNVWQTKMILPGEYEIRVLYDINNNGQWDPGNYTQKLQPEITLSVSQKIAIKADWENERDIELPIP